MITRLTDKRNYNGPDSGCELATTYRGGASDCTDCPFHNCIYDLGPGGAGNLAQRVYAVVRAREGAFHGGPVVVNKLTREVNFMSYVCPHCNKSLKEKKSLTRHIEKYHPGETAPPAPEPQKNEAEELEIETPEETATKYECGDCGHEIKKGDAACPGCGGELVWPS